MSHPSYCMLPTAHTHGDISSDGKLGTTAGLIVTTGTGGALQAQSLDAAGVATKTHNHDSVYPTIANAYNASNMNAGTLSTDRLPTVPLTKGGTGQTLTSAPAMLTNLASTASNSPFIATPRPGVTGTLGITNGGTGATTSYNAIVKFMNFNSARVNSVHFHNSIFRGNTLGNEVTEAQWTAIKTASFDDMFIGDYWTIGGITYRIAAFNYYYGNWGASSQINQSHITLVPDTNLYTSKMDWTGSSSTTANGYAGSLMFTSGLDAAKTTINEAFGEDHILPVKKYLVNSTTDGVPTATSACITTVDLMSEINVFGCNIQGARSTTSTANNTNDKSQYPLFAIAHKFILSNTWYWLKDTVDSQCFVDVGGIGYAGSNTSGTSNGVRPCFNIYQTW